MFRQRTGLIMKTWKAKLRKVYRSLEELKAYDRVYGVVYRLGFTTAEEAWEKNPLIGGSVHSKDFGRVKQ